MTDPRTDLDARVARAQGWELSGDGLCWLASPIQPLRKKRFIPITSYHPSRDPAQALAFAQACIKWELRLEIVWSFTVGWTAKITNDYGALLGSARQYAPHREPETFAACVCQAVLAAVEGER